ncbi:MAG: 3'(2'),5'-bisphosphate nucleotidase [Legionellaceae bacterium]|nr:3'(2'),5'-bisphosphate nucleotidase [Legionellaceae bacterium]
MNAVVRVARDAGKAVLDIYRSPEAFEVIAKQDGSPLTQADLTAHQIIVEGLKRLMPALPVLSEESSVVPWDQRKAWDRYWLVDPLDGTKEFIHRSDEFTVNIALIEDHRPVMGVVYAPALDVMYYAEQGRGAYKVEQGKVTQIRANHEVPTRVRVVASRRHGNSDQLKKMLSRFEQYELINVGSSLKICLVAEGKADIYPRLGPTSEWDTAAAHCVLSEAGGVLLRENNLTEIQYNTTESLLNPNFIAMSERMRATYFSR